MTVYGRLSTVTEPGTSIATIQYAYNSAGDVTAVTDEVGDTVTYTYDQMGRELSSQDPVQAAAGKDTAYVYDAAGNLISVTDALGNITTYSYNARNELVSVKDPLSQHHDIRIRRRGQQHHGRGLEGLHDDLRLQRR